MRKPPSPQKTADKTTPAIGDQPVGPMKTDEAAPELWAKFIWLRNRVGLFWGLLIAFFIAGGWVWTHWDDVENYPGIATIITLISQKEIPKADEVRFNIAIADFEGPAGDNMKNIVLGSLRNAFSVAHTELFHRSISTEQDPRLGHEQAKQLLKSSGFDVMIWGDVVSIRGESTARLHVTSLKNEINRGSRSLDMAEDLNLPPLIGKQLTDVLSLVIQTKRNLLLAGGGQYEADKLQPFIQQVRDLLDSSGGTHWNGTERAKVQAILADSLITFGEQSGNYEAVQQAVDILHEALEKTSPDASPVAWASMQRSFGTALQILGVHEDSPSRLAAAVSAYEAVLNNPVLQKEDRKRARVLHNLGIALASLGQTESKPELLKAAVSVFKKALLERKREKVPRQWALTQAMVGNTYLALGKIQSDPAQLEAAVSAYVSALNEFPCVKYPLIWAGTTNNLGIALMALGDDSSNSAQLESSAHAFEASLMVYRAEGAYYHSNDPKYDLKRVQDSISLLNGRSSDAWLKPASGEFLRVSLRQSTMRSGTYEPACWGMSSQLSAPGFPPLLSTIAMFCGRANGYNEFVFARLPNKRSCFAP